MQSPHPRLILLEPELLLAVRRRLFDGDPELMAADERLFQEARQARESAPASVLDKVRPGAGGEMRDYASIHPMWWPAADASNGLPYVRRIDEVNPEVRDWDQVRLNGTCSAIHTLCLAYFFSDLEEFAAYAAMLVRTWFLDQSMGMHPHLAYAAAVPGRCDGDHRGITEGVPLLWVLDGAGLLEESRSWSREEEQGLHQWFAAYLDWLRSSPQGRRQALAPDHNGTWYDVQVAAVGLYLGDERLCRQVVEEFGRRRIEEQIEADGRLVHEESQGGGLDLCVSNLTGLFDLADLGVRVGVDLWSYEPTGGVSLRSAFERLVESALEPAATDGLQYHTLLPLVRRGAIRFADPSAEQRLHRVGDVEASDRTNLLYPATTAEHLV